MESERTDSSVGAVGTGPASTPIAGFSSIFFCEGLPFLEEGNIMESERTDSEANAAGAGPVSTPIAGVSSIFLITLCVL